MNNSLLYNKYRPVDFGGIVGNEHITGILRNVVSGGRYRDTHLVLSGSPGNGKTSIARVYGRAINCERFGEVGDVCNECGNCLEHLGGRYGDYLELDGTSYNKVEDAKRLIELAKLHPIKSGYQRVIMIDEAHALSNQAFDKFLLLLESSSLRTTFIFSTTDVHLFRPAILSRCFTFEVSKLGYKDILRELVRVCEGEGIDYDLGALRRLAFYNNNKPRDAIKMLDMHVRAYGSFEKFDIVSQELLLLEIFRLAYFGKVDDYVEKLCKIEGGSLGVVLPRLFNELFFSDRVDPVMLGEEDVKGFFNVFSRENLLEMMREYMLLRPDGVEGLSLFLSAVVCKMGVSGGEVSRSVVRGRRFIGGDGGVVTVGGNVVSEGDLLSGGFVEED